MTRLWSRALPKTLPPISGLNIDQHHRHQTQSTSNLNPSHQGNSKKLESTIHLKLWLCQNVVKKKVDDPREKEPGRSKKTPHIYGVFFPLSLFSAKLFFRTYIHINQIFTSMCIGTLSTISRIQCTEKVIHQWFHKTENSLLSLCRDCFHSFRKLPLDSGRQMHYKRNLEPN